MSKNAWKYCIIVLILTAVYNVLIFVIPFPQKSVAIFWTSWAFGLLFLLIQPLIAYFGFKDAKTLKSKVYGWPIIRLGYLTLGLQLIITITFLVLGIFFNIPIWILAVLEVLLVAFTAIGLIVVDTYRVEVSNIENEAPNKLEFINQLKIDVTTLVEKETNEEIKKKLVALHEEVKYSDPVSSDALVEIENNIASKFTTLKSHIQSNSYETVTEEIDNMLVLLKERNTRAKMTK